jgi:hypothetical protein
MDHHSLAQIAGIAAALASLYAANSRTIVPLRIAAIVANVLAIFYSGINGTYPTFVLNAILLPLNSWRLYGMLKLIRDIDRATRSDMNAAWLLPYMRPASFAAGENLMVRGERGRDAIYITGGEVEIVELGKSVGAGSLLGEIALFTPDERRTMTVRAKTAVNAALIDYTRFKGLYYQNPDFGFRLLHLIVGRLQENNELPRVSASRVTNQIEVSG